YAPNSNTQADFPVAGLELKATGAVRGSRTLWRAKERLVLSIINFHDIVHDESFLDSAFFAKNARLLLVVYRWVKDESLLDNLVLAVDVVEICSLDARDQEIIQEDWVKIRDM